MRLPTSSERSWLATLPQHNLSDDQALAVCYFLLDLDQGSGPIPKTAAGQQETARMYLSLLLTL